MTECAFCRIADRSLDAVILWEDDDLVVFLDRAPIRRGHAQIVPRRHYTSFEQIPAPIATRMFDAGRRLSERLKEVYAPDRVVLLFTGVLHAHAHVVPLSGLAELAALAEERAPTNLSELQQIRTELALSNPV